VLMDDQDREVVTTTEAMAMLGVSRSTVTRLVQRGELEAYKLTTAKHSDLRIFLDSIHDLLRRRKIS
jgi:excisionase family DNA binding protein